MVTPESIHTGVLQESFISVEARRTRTHEMYNSVHRPSVVMEDSPHPIATGIITIEGLPVIFRAMKLSMRQASSFNGVTYETPWRPFLPLSPAKFIESGGEMSAAQQRHILQTLGVDEAQITHGEQEGTLNQRMQRYVAEKQLGYEDMVRRHLHSSTFRDDYHTAVAAILEDFETKQGLFEDDMV